MIRSYIFAGPHGVLLVAPILLLDLRRGFLHRLYGAFGLLHVFVLV